MRDRSAGAESQIYEGRQWRREREREGRTGAFNNEGADHDGEVSRAIYCDEAKHACRS